MYKQNRQLLPGQGREMIEYILPEQIEKRSFEIIEKELTEKGIVLPEEQAPVTKRVIHTSADFDYAKTLTFSKDAVETAKRLIKNGADVVTDTNMARSGINKKSLQNMEERYTASWQTRM